MVPYVFPGHVMGCVSFAGPPWASGPKFCQKANGPTEDLLSLHHTIMPWPRSWNFLVTPHASMAQGLDLLVIHPTCHFQGVRTLHIVVMLALGLDG